MTGQVAHGRAANADASGGVSIALFNAEGSSRTLGSKEVLSITDIVVSSLTAMSVVVGFGALSGGQILAKVYLTASVPTVTINLTTPFPGPVGVTPIYQSSVAGQVDITINGRIA